MNSNLDRIKNKISKGEIVIGTMVSLNDPIISEILCNCGFDFIWLDSEHTSISKETIDLHIMSIRGKGVAPFVRVPSIDPVLVKPILEMGPAAIIFPQVRTIEEAKLAVRSCKYPPEGVRGFGPRRSNNFYTIPIDNYLELSQSEPWVILQIEHIEAVNNLEDIVRIKGIDSITIGTFDLSASIGLLGQVRHPEVIKLIDKIEEVCNKAKIPWGPSMGTYNIDDIKAWINRRISWLQVEVDYTYLVNGGRNNYENVKKIFEELR